MNNRFVRALKWLARKPVHAWRSLPVRLILIFVASLFVMVAGVFVLTIVIPPRQNMTEFRIYGYSMIAVVIGGCYLAVRRLFYPLQDIRLGARRIGEGQLDYRIPIRRQDELGRLSERINRMADEVRRMLEGQRQLLLSLSHELRTPLTRAPAGAGVHSRPGCALAPGVRPVQHGTHDHGTAGGRTPEYAEQADVALAGQPEQADG